MNPEPRPAEGQGDRRVDQARGDLGAESCEFTAHRRHLPRAESTREWRRVVSDSQARRIAAELTGNTEHSIEKRREHDYVAAQRDAASRDRLGRGRQIRGRDVPLYVWRTGTPSAVPLVLAHGLFGSIDKDLVAEPWLWPLLGPSGPIDLVLYDARGHGRSGDARTAGGYAFEELGRDLVTVLDELGISRAVFGGSSLGAATAIAAAAIAPERAAGLLLFAPPPLGEAWTSHARAALSAAARVVRSAGIEALLHAMESRAENRSPRERPQRWRFERAHFAGFGVDRFATLIEGVGTGVLLDVDALRRLDVPALIVHHPNDADHPVVSADRIADSLPGAQRIEQPDWDEALERPAARADLIVNFVHDVARRSIRSPAPA